MGRELRRWLGGLIAAAVVLVGVAGVVNGVRRIGDSFPGFLLAHNGIVVSIGRADWAAEMDPRIPFSQVIGVVGSPAATATEVLESSARMPAGAEVNYRFRRGSEVFDAAMRIRPFTAADFLSLYANYFLVGLAFALAGLVVLWGADSTQPAHLAFFVLAQISALALLTAGDVYGPYWFTHLYFTAHCLTPAALLHFASAFPEPVGRRGVRVAALAVVYGAAALLALGVNVVADSPSLFLPLVYTVNLLLANAILLYIGRLLVSRYDTAERERRRAVDLALAGILLAATLPAAILVVYPAVEGFISPLFVVAPLLIFPLFTAMALRRGDGASGPSPGGSVRLRLSLLFLAAVQTGFLAAIAYFWLSSSWQQLLADLALHQRQQSRLEQLRLDDASALPGLAEIESQAHGPIDRAIAERARDAVLRGDHGAARTQVQILRTQSTAEGSRLERRRRWLSRMDAALVLGLLLAGVAQAVAFTIAIRRWLIQPLRELGRATAVLATGDLSHRSRLDSSEEFAALAESINGMAASLAAIRERVDAERTSRERAAAAARDTERKRLARELHDGVLQDLGAVKLAVEGLARRGATEPAQGVVQGIIQAMVGLRRVVDDLRPPDLSHVSLGAAIESHARGMAQRHGAELTLDLGAADQVADWAVRDVYRIAQEAVTNAVRHGSPRHLTVTMAAEGAALVLEVRDDGAGYDPGSAMPGGGLAGMAERAAAIGSTLEVRGSPGAGVAVRVVVPRAGGRAPAPPD